MQLGKVIELRLNVVHCFFISLTLYVAHGRLIHSVQSTKKATSILPTAVSVKIFNAYLRLIHSATKKMIAYKSVKLNTGAQINPLCIEMRTVHLK